MNRSFRCSIWLALLAAANFRQRHFARWSAWAWHHARGGQYRVTPDEFRGRVNSVNAMFAFGGNQFGQVESGLVANFSSPQFAVVSGGLICILSTLIIVALVPKVLLI